MTTDQSLREALEPLIAASEAHGARFDFQLARFRTMLAEQQASTPLAAHPAEPAPTCKGHCYATVETGGSGAPYVDATCPKHGQPVPSGTEKALVEHQRHGSPQADCVWCPVPSPVPVGVEITDDAAEAVGRSMFEAVHELDWSHAEGPTRTAWIERGRAALEAARPALDAALRRAEL